MRQHTSVILGSLAIVLVASFLYAPEAEAKTTGSMTPTIKRLSPTGSTLGSFNAFSASMKQGARVALGDTDGDGLQNIVAAAGVGAAPEVRVYTLEGDEVLRFTAYAKTFRGGVNVSVFDLDSDGRAEIVTAPGAGGGPDIKIFDGNGNQIRHFFAFDKKFRGGASVVAHAFGRNGEPLIAVGSGYGSGHVRVFNPQGEFTGIGFFPFGKITHGVTLGALPVDGERTKLLAAPERSAPAVVKIYNLDSTSSPEKSFSALPSTFRGGVRVTGADLDSDGTSEVIVAAGAGGGPQIRVFSASGTAIRSFFVYSTSFRGGVNVAAMPQMIVTAPGAVSLDGRTDLHKYIEVDLSEQTLKYYQDGKLLGTRRVSSGKWTTPTPVGTHVIKNKIPIAYSKPYNLYMEWWMAFTPDGSYGLHALPFWKTANGGKYYEGASHLGTPVSHGCIRQTLAEAKSLFAWADIGTTVIVKR